MASIEDAGVSQDGGKPVLRWSCIPVETAWVPSWDDEVSRWAENRDEAAPGYLGYRGIYDPEVTSTLRSPLLLRGEAATFPAEVNGREAPRVAHEISIRRAVHYAPAGERAVRAWDWRRQSPGEVLETLDFEDGGELTAHYNRFGPLGHVNIGSASSNASLEPLWWIRGCVIWMGFLRQLAGALVRRDSQLLHRLLGPARRNLDPGWDSTLGIEVARAYGERDRSTPASEREYYQEGWRILQVGCGTVCDPLTESLVGQRSPSGRQQGSRVLSVDPGVALSAGPLACYGSFVGMAAADLGIAVARKTTWAQCEHPPCDEWFPVHREGTRWCPQHRTAAARAEVVNSPAERTEEDVALAAETTASRGTSLASRLMGGAKAVGSKVRGALNSPRRRQ